MVELLSKFSSGELIAIVAIVGGLICGTIVMIGEYWHEFGKPSCKRELKQDMLDRGMSADEIRMVLEAGTKKSPMETCGR